MADLRCLLGRHHLAWTSVVNPQGRWHRVRACTRCGHIRGRGRRL